MLLLPRPLFLQRLLLLQPWPWWQLLQALKASLLALLLLRTRLRLRLLLLLLLRRLLLPLLVVRRLQRRQRLLAVQWPLLQIAIQLLTTQLLALLLNLALFFLLLAPPLARGTPPRRSSRLNKRCPCLLYTSDAADE